MFLTQSLRKAFSFSHSSTQELRYNIKKTQSLISSFPRKEERVKSTMDLLKNAGVKSVALLNLDKVYGPVMKWGVNVDGDDGIDKMLVEIYTMFMVGMSKNMVPRAMIFDDKNVVVSARNYNLLCFMLRKEAKLEEFLNYAEKIMEKFNGEPSKSSCLKSLVARLRRSSWKEQ